MGWGGVGWGRVYMHAKSTQLEAYVGIYYGYMGVVLGSFGVGCLFYTYGKPQKRIHSPGLMVREQY